MTASGPVRWGIVGTGTISQTVAADLALVDGAEIAAVCSRDATRGRSFADEIGAAVAFDDYTRMLNSEIDAIYIGTPHTTHFALASEAIRSGKHVLCEKPLGLSATEVCQLAATAEEQDVFLMEAMRMKFNPLYERLRALIADGVLGEVRSIQASLGIPFPQDDSSRWKPGGSALLDQGIYPVTLAHLLFGPPSGIVARGRVREDGVDLSEHSLWSSLMAGSSTEPARWSSSSNSRHRSPEQLAGSSRSQASGRRPKWPCAAPSQIRAAPRRSLKPPGKATGTCPC